MTNADNNARKTKELEPEKTPQVDAIPITFHTQKDGTIELSLIIQGENKLDTQQFVKAYPVNMLMDLQTHLTDQLVIAAELLPQHETLQEHLGIQERKPHTAAAGHAYLDSMLPDEPVFILRGQDLLATEVLRDWINRAQAHNYPGDKAREAQEIAHLMDHWPNRKFPD